MVPSWPDPVEPLPQGVTSAAPLLPVPQQLLPGHLPMPRVPYQLRIDLWVNHMQLTLPWFAEWIMNVSHVPKLKVLGSVRVTKDVQVSPPQVCREGSDLVVNEATARYLAELGRYLAGAVVEPFQGEGCGIVM